MGTPISALLIFMISYILEILSILSLTIELLWTLYPTYLFIPIEVLVMQRMLYSCKVEVNYDVFSFLSEVKRVKDGSRLGLAYYDRDDFCSSLFNSAFLSAYTLHGIHYVVDLPLRMKHSIVPTHMYNASTDSHFTAARTLHSFQDIASIHFV
jgi:hypothetical protein